MRAVVLAAGKGTRMREITESIPKPLVEVGGQPVLWHVLRALAGAGVSEAAIIIGYKGEKIRSCIRDGKDVGLKVRYFMQEVQDGTGRAAEPARDFLSGGPFFLTFGDILMKASAYRRMADERGAHPTDLLLAVRWVEDPHRGGAVTLDGDRITEIVEKPPEGTATTHWINAGVLIADPVLFEYTSRLSLSPRGEYELPDAMRMMIREGRSVEAFRLESYWRDIGTPEDLAEASRDANERDDVLPDT